MPLLSLQKLVLPSQLVLSIGYFRMVSTEPFLKSKKIINQLIKLNLNYVYVVQGASKKRGISLSQARPGYKKSL